MIVVEIFAGLKFCALVKLIQGLTQQKVEPTQTKQTFPALRYLVG